MGDYVIPEVKGKTTYSLRGWIVYKQCANAGHYIAKVKHPDNNTWFECDDEEVTEIKSASKTMAADSPNVRILCYTRDE